jgi:hypothetical protein
MMAKKLPYFKFYPSEWFVGDITLCSIEAQGLFINIINFYWLKDCSICLANVKQRFSNASAQLNELLEHNIIKVDEQENVIIDFLDEQMQEFIDVRAKRAIAGTKGGRASAKQMLSKRQAKSSNIDKNKVDKNRVYNLKEGYIKKYPNALKIVKHFIKTLETDSRYIPKSDKQKLEWLKVAQWSINQMGEHGYEKVIDIIDYFRNGHADNNNFSWGDNWLSLKKLQNKNKDGVTYLDYFWEKAKEKFEYGSKK